MRTDRFRQQIEAMIIQVLGRLRYPEWFDIHRT